MKLIRTLIAIFLCIITNTVFANCSFDYIGKAALNEVFAKLDGGNNQRRGYLEVKLISSSITQAAYETWKVKICTDNSCETLSLADANDSNAPWVYFDKNDFSIDLIDFENGFDLSLLDENNNFIDYISVEGVNQQNFEAACSYDDLSYVFPIPDTGNGTKLLHRTPDGVGAWTAFSANNGETPGNGNTPPTDDPHLVVSDDTVVQGDTENFIISIENEGGDPAYSISDITVFYSTQENTATSPEHYSGTFFSRVTIPAGFNSATVPISTVYIGDQITRDFYFEILFTLGADITDGVGIGIITPLINTLVTHYQMDELIWNGTSGEVLNELGTLHGTAFGGLNTDKVGPAWSGNPGTCGYGDFDGIDDYIAVEDDPALDLADSLTLSAWIYPTKAAQQVIISKARRASSSNNYQLQLGAGNTLLFQYRSGGVDKSVPTFTPVPTNTWSHVAVTYIDGEQRFYINGVETDTGNNTGALDINGATLDIGAERIFDSSTVGQFHFKGRIDEVKVYEGALSAADIGVIYQEKHACATGLIAYYQLDELSWNGTTNEVFNELGALHGTAFGGANTSNINPARDGNPGTCGYGIFDGIDGFVEIAHDDSLSFTDEFTVSTWIYPTKLPSSGLMTILSKDDNYEFHVTPSGEINWWWSTDQVFTANADILPDNWYHIAITYKDGEQIIYVNGVNKGQGNQATNLFTDTDPLQIGQDQGFPGRYFQGRIDEVKIYEGALSASAIEDLYQEVHPCDSYIDHFEVDTLDQTGITCQADNIVIKACADAACNTINPNPFDVELLINNVVYKTVTVSGENGTATSYSYTTMTPNVAALSLDQTYQCTNSTSEPCNVTFADSGFLFSAIPTQISGKPSNEGFNASTLILQAVETDTNTGACAAIFPDGGDIEVNLSYNCENGTCSDDVVLTNNSNSYNITTISSPKELRFETDSTATFAINYPDAGKLSLNAQKLIEVEDSDGNKETKNLVGISQSFVERPFAFKLDFSQDVNGANAFAQDGSGNPDASKSPFKKAGETFKLTATAVQWSSGQDNTPFDGVPDDFSTISGNATAKYFASEELIINHELLLPNLSDGASPGILTTEVSNTFANSVITNEYNYSEVGILKLAVKLKDSDYLGVGDIFGEVRNVGRFTPAYFIQTVNSHGTLNANHYDTCEINDWAYSGQTQGTSNNGAISYDSAFEPVIEITAFNLDGDITQNYTQTGFMKLPASGITIPLPIADNDEARLFPDVADEKVHISSVMTPGEEPEASDTDGVVTYTFNSQDNFVYEHNKHSKLKAYSAAIPFLVTEVKDTDNIKLYEGSDTNIIVTEKVISTGVEIRFGRWLLENSYGPETSALPVTMFTQYFNGDNFDDNDFINNTNESCLVPVIGVPVRTGDVGDAGLNLWDYRLVDLDTGDNLFPADTDASFEDEDKSFIAGIYQWLIFSEPGQQGPLKVEYQVPTWLQYDWNNDDVFTNNPRATLTFGIYRGNDRIIYQREIQRTN